MGFRLLGMLLLALLLLQCSVGSSTPASGERNNWAVLVETSRYWYNYRHAANVLTFYHTIKRLGIPDSHIILMMADDMACNPRNARPGTVFNEMHHHQNLYGEDVEVDYRGDEVSVDAFLRLLTGKHTPNTARSKRLLTDSMSNIFIFLTGHSGDEFVKFQDWEEITSTDIADAFAQMHSQRRYKQIFWLSDTCQAATLQNQFYSPEIIALGSSRKKENSYSHHVDPEIGVAIVDRFTFNALNFLNLIKPSSSKTLKNFIDFFDPRSLNSNPEMRSDLFSQLPSETLITQFLAATGRMRFQDRMLQMSASSGDAGVDHVCTARSTTGHSGTPQCNGSMLARDGIEAPKAPSHTHGSMPPNGLWQQFVAAYQQLHKPPTTTKFVSSAVNAEALPSGSIEVGGSSCGNLLAAAPWLFAFLAVVSAADNVGDVVPANSMSCGRGDDGTASWQRFRLAPWLFAGLALASAACSAATTLH